MRNDNEPRQCSLCGGTVSDDAGVSSPYAEAGAWLAAEVWQDVGSLCRQCLENRARLSMMYLHEHNT